MRKLSLILLALVGSLLLFGGAAIAQDDATKAEITALYTPIAQQIQKGQNADLGKAAHAEFKHVSLLGKEGKADQWNSEFKQVIAAIKAPEFALSLNTLTVKDNEATAIFATEAAGDGALPDGRMGNLKYTLTERTLWAKADGAWKLKTVKHVMTESRIDKRLIPFRGATTGDEDTRQALQQVYDLMADVYGKADWATLEKTIPDTFPIVDATGATISKKEMIDRLKKGSKLLQNPIVFMTVQALGKDGDAVKVVRLATVVADVALPGGKMGRLKYINCTRDTWAKGEKTWGAKKTEELHADAWLDGKQLPLALISGN